MGRYVSIGARVLLNVEALNMVESVGNLTKHRRAPLVIPDGDGYKLVYVPAISGESLAHAIQENVVNVAKVLYGGSPPVDEWSLRGEFYKFGDRAHMPPSLRELLDRASKRKNAGEVADAKHELEKAAIRESIVADVGGFLIAEKLPVKRTSTFYVGYLVPVYDALEATAIESQFHVRHVASESQGAAGEEGERAAQMIYYVEVGSAVYGLSVAVNLSQVGRTSLIKVENAVSEEERKLRAKALLAAIGVTLAELSFGAKRSRFSPIGEVLELVAAVSEPKPFMVSSPHRPGFAEDTVRRAEDFKAMLAKLGIEAKVDLLGYSRSKLPEGVRAFRSPEALFAELLKYAEDLP